MKILPVEPSCCMTTEGQTDMTKLIVAIHNYTKTSKNVFRLIPPTLGTKGETALIRAENKIAVAFSPRDPTFKFISVPPCCLGVSKAGIA